MTYDELKKIVREMLPEAIFDRDFGTGEIVIASGMVEQTSGELRSVLPDERL